MSNTDGVVIFMGYVQQRDDLTKEQKEQICAVGADYIKQEEQMRAEYHAERAAILNRGEARQMLRENNLEVKDQDNGQ